MAICFGSSAIALRTTHGPFGMRFDFQMILRSAMSRRSLSTMERSAPREKPSASSPTPDVQVTPASYWPLRTATTACSWPPPKPVEEK